MKITLKSISVLALASLALSGCIATSKRPVQYQKLLNGPSDEIILPMNYIDAFANAKHNYEKCVAKSSFQTPIYTKSMGTTITTMATMPGTYIKTSLDRQNALGILDIDIGDQPVSILQFRPYGENQTQLTVYQIRKLLSKTYQKQVDNAQKYSSARLDRCL